MITSERNKQKPFPTPLAPRDRFQTEHDKKKTIEKCTVYGFEFPCFFHFYTTGAHAFDSLPFHFSFNINL